MTVSVWWVLWAFLGGGWAGILVMAIMYVVSREDDRVEHSLSPNPQRVIAEPV